MDKNFNEILSDELLKLEMELGEEFDSKNGKFTEEEWIAFQRKIEERVRALSEKHSGIAFSSREKRKVTDKPERRKTGVLDYMPGDEPVEVEEPIEEKPIEEKPEEKPIEEKPVEKAPVDEVAKDKKPSTPRGKRVSVPKQPQRAPRRKRVEKRKRSKRISGGSRRIHPNALPLAMLFMFLVLSIGSFVASCVVYFLKDTLYPFNFLKIPVTLPVFVGLACLEVATIVIVAITIYKKAKKCIAYPITMTALFLLSGSLSGGLLFVIGLIVLIRVRRRILESVSLGLVIQGFLLGQVVQYVEYFSTGKSFLIDYFFGQYMTDGMPVWVLPLLSLLGAITAVHVAIRVYNLGQDGDDYPSWWYAISSTILFVVCPQVSSTVGFIIAIACSFAGKGIEEKIPVHFVLQGAFVTGNGIAWLMYAKNGSILLVDQFMERIGFAGFNPLAYLIIATILNLFSTIVTSILVANFYGENKSSTIVGLPFVILQLALPMISAVPLAICAIVYIFAILSGDEGTMYYTGFGCVAGALVAVIVLSIVSLTYDESKKDYFFVTNESQITNRLDEKNILLDISGYSNYATIDTESGCESLKLRGGAEVASQVYIKTEAKYIELDSIHGVVDLVIEKDCLLVLSGSTSVQVKSLVLCEGVRSLEIVSPDTPKVLDVKSLEVKEKDKLDLTLDKVSLKGCGTLDLKEGDLSLVAKGEIVLGFGLYAKKIDIKIDNRLEISGGEMGISATESLALAGEGALLVNAGTRDDASRNTAGEKGFSAIKTQSLTVLGTLDIVLTGGNGQNGGNGSAGGNGLKGQDGNHDFQGEDPVYGYDGRPGGNGGNGENGAIGGKGGSGLSVGVISSFSDTSKMTLIGGNGGKGGNGGAGGNGGDGGDSGIKTIIGFIEVPAGSGGAGGNAGRGGYGALGGEAGVGLEYTTEPNSSILEKITITNGISGEKGVDGVDGMPGKVGEGK